MNPARGDVRARSVPRGSGRPGSRKGFSLIELLVTLVVLVVILTGVYGILQGQVGAYRKQQDMGDSRAALRAAAQLLTWELRHVRPEEGDLIAFDSASMTVRSVVGSGVVCVRHPLYARYGLIDLSGDVSMAAADSVQVFAPGSVDVGDDRWTRLRIQQLGNPSSLGVGTCALASSPPATLGLEVISGDTTGIAVGSPVRFHRDYRYRVYLSGGRYWLGRREMDSFSYVPLAGPMQPGGLRLRFFDDTGTVTSIPSQAVSVELTLLTQGFGNAISGDSLTTTIRFRGP